MDGGHAGDGNANLSVHAEPDKATEYIQPLFAFVYVQLSPQNHPSYAVPSYMGSIYICIYIYVYMHMYLLHPLNLRNLDIW